jgi:DNA polymerase-3 subunit epsilon
MTIMTDMNTLPSGVPSDTGGAGPVAGSVAAAAAAIDPAAVNTNAIAAAFRLLVEHPDHQVLRRISETTLPVAGDDTDTPTQVGVVVDVETEGLDPARDAIIELAMRRFRFDAAGRIVAVGATRAWREDPGRPLDPAITRLTGLTDADLAGQTIDENAATAILRSADVVIAHNAGFDRPRVEARLPGGAGRPWACTLSEVDWDELGFDGRRLGHLLMQAGWFHDGHRAEADILALLHLLAHHCPDDTTVLGRLIARAEAPTVRVEARGAAFSLKDALKARGYRWHVADAYWWTEVAEPDLMAEQLWLQRRGCRPPRTVPVTWSNRHS